MSEQGGPLAVIKGSHLRMNMLKLFKEHNISPFSGDTRSDEFNKKIEKLISTRYLEKEELLAESPGEGFIFNNT